MRVLTFGFLLFSLVACDGGSSGPDAPAILVRVIDDRGAPGNRMQVVVTLSSGGRIVARTRGDGTVHVGVPESGTHRVTIIPRAGYLGDSAGLTRSVTIGGEASVAVDFTVQREGVAMPNPGEPITPP